MFVSSMARRNGHERSKSADNFKKARQRSHKSSKTDVDVSDATRVEENCSFEIPMSKTSIDSGVLVNGSRKELSKKSLLSLSNSEKTIRPSSSELPPRANVETTINYLDGGSKNSLNFSTEQGDNYEVNDNELRNCYEEDLKRQFQERLDLSSRNLSGVRGFSESDTTKHNWYLDPVHRRTRDRIPLSVLEKTDPFQVAIFRSAKEKNLQDSETNDNFNLQPFAEAEKHVIKQHLIAKAGLVSPYELELCRLRYEKLKLEEAYLLKLKCEEELERTRGPKPKWYELKTKEFTREMDKYKSVMENKDNWQKMLEYRNNLLEISGEWSNLRH